MNFKLFKQIAAENILLTDLKFLSELNTQPFTKAMALVLRKVTKKC